jgi:ribosomal protein S18 acetylase RimI-like enzyme
VAVRPGTVADIPVVLPLVAKTIAFHAELDPARFGAVPNAYQRYDGWMRRTAGSDDGAFFVAEEAGLVVGFVLGQVQEEYALYRTGRYGMVHDLWVEPEHRGKGVAKALMLATLDHFRRAGVKQARLDSAAANAPAQRLFAQCGFRPSVTEMLAELAVLSSPPQGS